MSAQPGAWHHLPHPNGWIDPDAAELPIGDDEPAGVLGEVWPLAIDPTVPTDRAGIWLVSGTLPWSTPFKKQGVRMHDLIVGQLTLRDIPVRPTTPLHQTSDRDIGIAMVVTYLALIPCDGPVRARWPLALPVSRDLDDMVGKPPTHGAGERPQPRDWDVLTHGLGHFHWLRNNNATYRRDFGPRFGLLLEEWDETRFKHFDREHQSA